MDYRAEIINIVNRISDNRVLAFLYGLFDEIVKHIESLENVNPR